MRDRDPDPTELQFFGITGILLSAAAVAGLLYAAVSVLKWLSLS